MPSRFGGVRDMAWFERPTTTTEPGVSAEDLGEDIMALASVVAEHGRASMVRRVNGIVVRVTVEAA